MQDNSAVNQAASAAGQEWQRAQNERQARHIDPPVLGYKDPSSLTGEQYDRVHSYDGWDGDLRWPHPQFQRDEQARAQAIGERDAFERLKRDTDAAKLRADMQASQRAIQQNRWKK